MSQETVANNLIAKLVRIAAQWKESSADADKLAHGQTHTLNLEGAAAMIALALSKSALDALGTALMTCIASE